MYFYLPRMANNATKAMRNFCATDTTKFSSPSRRSPKSNSPSAIIKVYKMMIDNRYFKL